MAEVTMGLTERLILEFARDCPGQSTTAASRALGVHDVAAKTAVSALVTAGYLEGGRVSERRGSMLPLKWTGKPFPASADYEVPQGRSKSSRYEDELLLEAKKRREAMALASVAIRAMIDVGRAPA